jgi:hypothetical protein
MTYDELLAKINNLPEAIGLAEFKVRHDALRAVVELHKPISDNSCYDPGCCGGPYPDLCGICSEDYPCPTIEAIEKEFV